MSLISQERFNLCHRKGCYSLFLFSSFLLTSYLISQIFLLKSILKVLWYLYGALLSNKIMPLVTKLLLRRFFTYLYLQLVATVGITVCGGTDAVSAHRAPYLPLHPNCCFSEAESQASVLLSKRHPTDAFTWHPFIELMTEGISLQWLTNLIWSVCRRNLPFTERDPLFIVLGLLMYYIFTGIESHLRFIALTSEMISLFLISLLLIVCYSSQLQPASFKCWAPKPGTGTSCSSSQHLASSFS